MNSFPFGGGWDHVTDLNLLSGDHNTINYQLDELAFLLKGSLSKSLLDTLTKGFYRLDHACQLIMVPHIRFQLPPLFSDDGQPLF